MSRRVAPILQDNCVSCHREGSIAPMSLRTYEEVRPRARLIEEYVERRQVPPSLLRRRLQNLKERLEA